MTNKSWFEGPREGAKGLAIGIGIVAIVVGIMPAIFLRERFNDAEHSAGEPVAGEGRLGALKRNLVGFGKGCATTLRSKQYLKLCFATFLVFNGFIMISSFQSYVIIYYVFGGNQELGARFAGYSGTVGAISTFAVIFFITWLSTKIGKRRAFFVSTAVSMVGYAIKWFCYNPRYPYLLLVPAPLIAFGLGGLFTLMGSMIADVVDVDELETRQRREGMFGAIYWWVVKVGMAAALAGGGYLLNATGFDVALGGKQLPETLQQMRILDVLVPFLTSGLAIWIIASYNITEEKAHEVRKELERRRGTAKGATAVAS